MTVDNTGNASALTDHQVSIAVTYDADMQADFDDLRFTSSDGTTLLSHWLETKTDSTSAVVWVKVPSVGGSSTATVYMYYGNASASSASNGSSTFLAFGDFDIGGTATKDASNPVITPSGVGANNPSVLRIDASTLWIWYTTGEPSGKIVRRVSTDDGATWGAESDALANARWCSVIKVGSTYRMVYTFSNLTTYDSIYLATSTDGVTWTPQGALLTIGAGGAWDDTWVTDPSEILIDGTYYLYYAGWSSTAPGDARIGLATSSTGNAGSYTKHASNPVLSQGANSYEDVGVYDPSIIDTGSGKYVLLYSGFNGTEQLASYATSTDLVTWTRSNRILYGTSQAWEEAATYGPNEPYALLENGVFRVWYNGNPDLGRIGYLTIPQDATTREPQTLGGPWGMSRTSSLTVRLRGGEARLSAGVVDASLYATPTVTDGIIETKMKYVSGANAQSVGRWSISPTGYTVGGSGIADRLYLARQPFASLGYASFTHGSGHNVYQLTLSGTAIKAKAWHYGDAEPGYAVEATDSTYASGGSGIEVYNSTAYADWFRVRKYASPQPTTSIGPEENVPYPPWLPAILSRRSVR